MWLPTFSSLHNLCLCCLLILSPTILLIHLIADPLFALSFQGHCHMVGEEEGDFFLICVTVCLVIYFLDCHIARRSQYLSIVCIGILYSTISRGEGGGNERHFYPLDQPIISIPWIAPIQDKITTTFFLPKDQILSSLNPLTSTLPVPFLLHSPSSSSSP